MNAYHSLTDIQLFQLLQDGDIRAFTEVHVRYYDALYHHAYRRFPDREEVKDLIQEIFLSVWNNRCSININTSLSAYLFTAVRNRILNVYKHQKVQSAYLHSFQQFLNNSAPETDEALRTKQLLSVIEKEVAKFPPQMRLIFEMSRAAQLSHREIAGELHISVHTVKKQVQHSLKILRVKLSTYFFLFFF